MSLKELFGLVDEYSVAGEQHHPSLLAVPDLNDAAVEMIQCTAGDRIEQGRPAIPEQVPAVSAAAAPGWR